MAVPNQSSNFGFLAEHDPLFVKLAVAAERAFASDPNTTLIKLRQLGEAIAQDLAAKAGIEFDEQTSQSELLYRLQKELRLEPVVRDLFHTLRIEGNKATHQFKTQHKQAMKGLVVARDLSIWFHRSFGKQGSHFKPGAFSAPSDPSAQLQTLQQNIAELKAQLEATNKQLENDQQLQQLLEQEKAEYEALAFAMDEEARSLGQKLEQHEAELKEQQRAYEARIKRLQTELASANSQEQSEQKSNLRRSTQAASAQISLSEKVTRILIDQQLNDAGWLADTESLDYRKGTRPQVEKNMAIAEWPTRTVNENGIVKTGRADYVLFNGLTPMAIVEAKRKNANVAGKISQAERYSRGIILPNNCTPAWQLAGMTVAWPDEGDSHFIVPFVYSCNGRPFVKQLQEQSGTWFRDVRSPSNLKKPNQGFHTPEGLLDRLTRDKAQAEAKLITEPFGYLKLRDYQQKAITAAEQHINQGAQEALIAMATGTGKTRTIIGLMYRLLKAERFQRILFLVDRTALGSQAIDAFHEAPLEQNQTLSKIYNVNELGDMAAEAETRIQVATVQAMVKRLFSSDSPPAIDQFDCIIIDEAHRGYTLDQDMTEGELGTREATQYLSSYRRVLDYFDAVKIALTATPAKHTIDIFGRPVYSYSYREAVADDWLIDHEPPVRFITELSKNGIKFQKGDAVDVVNPQTQEVTTEELEDELNFEVEAFNRRVINENFNRVICEQLAQELDPFDDEKTLIFCATDLHADIVKRQLDNAFKDLYGDQYNQAAVEKITGQSDKVAELIRRYKNERHPNIAITVDLLTTGIDVPKICNLVFMRRVKSRILYEQMIGRATRRCDDIGKTLFRIYDPVDIYATLADVNTMKPLVKDPKVTLEQLSAELTDPETLDIALNLPGDVAGSTQADTILDQLSQKVMRVLRKAQAKVDKSPSRHPTLKQKLDELHDLWGIEPNRLHQHIHELGPEQAAEFIRQHGDLTAALAEVKVLLGSEYLPVLSQHEDQIMDRVQNYGEHQKPEDYLNSFNQFIQDHLYESAALSAVINKPRDLTRAQLKEVKLLLDEAGYTDTKLQTAWRSQTNQDIAASIIGHIRRAAIGEILEPFEKRVERAMQRILTLHAWTPAQKKWLDRLAKQLVHELIVDDTFVNQRFNDQGGAKQLNKVLNGQLDQVLIELRTHLWDVA